MLLNNDQLYGLFSLVISLEVSQVVVRSKDNLVTARKGHIWKLSKPLSCAKVKVCTRMYSYP